MTKPTEHSKLSLLLAVTVASAAVAVSALAFSTLLDVRRFNCEAEIAQLESRLRTQDVFLRGYSDRNFETLLDVIDRLHPVEEETVPVELVLGRAEVEE